MRQGVSLCQANKCKRPLGGSLEADHRPHTVLGPGCDSLAVWPLRWREGHLCLHAASMCTCSTVWSHSIRVFTRHPCVLPVSVCMPSSCCTPSIRVYVQSPCAHPASVYTCGICVYTQCLGVHVTSMCTPSDHVYTQRLCVHAASVCTASRCVCVCPGPAETLHPGPSAERRLRRNRCFAPQSADA